MRKVDLLRQLQRVDQALDRGRERLTELEPRLGDRSALDAAIAELETRQRTLRRLESEQVDLDLQVEDLRGKLKAIEEKLYGGKVRNPKELQDLSREAEQLRRRISAAEDRLLECYEQVEQAATLLNEARALREQAEREWQERQASLGRELAELRAELASLERERERVRAEVDGQALRVYEGLRRTRNGLAVAEIRQRTCQGCRVSLPMSEEHRARSTPDLVLCPNCGRILFAAL